MSDMYEVHGLYIGLQGRWQQRMRMVMSVTDNQQMRERSAPMMKGVSRCFTSTLLCTKNVYTLFPKPSFLKTAYLVAAKRSSLISSQLFSQPTTATKEALLTFKLITVKTPFSTSFVKSTSNSSIERLEYLRQVEKVLGAYMLCHIISTSSLAVRGSSGTGVYRDR